MARDERLGFLTFSPENLGNSISVSVRLNLTKLSQDSQKLCEIAETSRLKITKLSDNLDNHVYEVKNKKQLGLTEFETVNLFAEGIKALINDENS